MSSVRLGPGYTVVVSRHLGLFWARVYYNGYAVHVASGFLYNTAVRRAHKWIDAQTRQRERSTRPQRWSDRP